jgi:sigma-B regulation protein RsbU (phosphoserine phosphatase)
MGFYAALTYVDIDPSQLRVTLLNAGNPFPILIHSDGTHELIEQANSVPLGIPVQSHPYEPWEMSLKKGEKIVLYTDGISESKDVKGKYYTEERLRKLVSKNHHLGAKELRDLISQDVGAFLNGIPQSDDQTLLVIHAVCIPASIFPIFSILKRRLFLKMPR